MSTDLMGSNFESLWPNNKINDFEFQCIWAILLDVLLWMSTLLCHVKPFRYGLRDSLYGLENMKGVLCCRVSCSSTVTICHPSTHSHRQLCEAFTSCSSSLPTFRLWDLKAVTISFPSGAGLTITGTQSQRPEWTEGLRTMDVSVEPVSDDQRNLQVLLMYLEHCRLFSYHFPRKVNFEIAPNKSIHRKMKNCIFSLLIWNYGWKFMSTM